MRRVTDAALAIAALVLCACALWPRSSLPPFLFLLSLPLAVVIGVWARTAATHAAAIALLSTVLTAFALPMIAMPGEAPTIDLRTLWLLVLVVTLSLLATPTFWRTVRPASIVTAAVIATLPAPPSDTSFYSVCPPVLLQFAVLAAAVLLVAFVPVAKWRRRAALLYVAIEPLLVALAAWIIVAPFVRDGRMPLPLGMRHFLAIFGAPACVATAILSARALRTPNGTL